MPRLLSADDVMPLVAALSDKERAKLLKRIASAGGTDSLAYLATPPNRDEFSNEEEPLAWEAHGWDQFR